MWNPPVELSGDEEWIFALAKKGPGRFFAFLRSHRHELLDPEFQAVLKGVCPNKGGKPQVEGALMALVTLLQAYSGVSDRDAVYMSMTDRSWQLVLDCLDCRRAPFSQGTLFNFRQRIIEHNLDKVLLDRTVKLAEKFGDFGPRQLRAALDSSPLWGAGRVEDTLNLLHHALRKSVRLAAQELGESREQVVEKAGLTLIERSSLKAALDLDWSRPEAKKIALGRVLEEIARWKSWLEQVGLLNGPSMKAAMQTIEEIIAKDTEPDPEGGGPGKRRIKREVAADRRISVEDPDMRHGRKTKSKSFNGFKQHLVVDLDSKVTREVIVRPANEAEHLVVDLARPELERGRGLRQLNIDLGYMGSELIQRWFEQGVHIIARPWRQPSELFTKEHFKLDFEFGRITCPAGQSVAMSPGVDAKFRASFCDPCSLRSLCTNAKPGKGRSIFIREDELFQHKLRAKQRTKRGRESLRKRVVIEHRISHLVSTQGRRARYKGLRKNQFDGRRHAALNNLQLAAGYLESPDAA